MKYFVNLMWPTVLWASVIAGVWVNVLAFDNFLNMPIPLCFMMFPMLIVIIYDAVETHKSGRLKKNSK